MQNQELGIRLKAFDHRLIDQSTAEIVDRQAQLVRRFAVRSRCRLRKERFTVLISAR